MTERLKKKHKIYKINSNNKSLTVIMLRFIHIVRVNAPYSQPVVLPRWMRHVPSVFVMVGAPYSQPVVDMMCALCILSLNHTDLMELEPRQVNFCVCVYVSRTGLTTESI